MSKSIADDVLNAKPKLDALKQLFEHQAQFMERLNVKCILRNDAQEVIQQTMPIAYALLDEVHEVMDELPWKPWKTAKKPVSLPRVHEELIDCWFFLLELSIMWGMSPEMVAAMYEEKLKINHERQDKGY